MAAISNILSVFIRFKAFLGNASLRYIKDINTFQQQLKSGKIIPKQTTKVIYDSSQFTKSLTNEFSIISNKKSEKHKIIY